MFSLATLVLFIHVGLTLGATVTGALPDYVLKYAPLSRLHTSEKYFPADIAEHLKHVEPQVDRKAIASAVSFDTIGSLGSDVFLTSKDNVDKKTASWFYGVKPDSTGYTSSPGTIIAVPKANGVVDAFYFYFYSYDHAEFLDIQVGDHVGDWEHTMVRFINGQPDSIYLSAHSSGSAYKYSALQSSNGRAVTYIAEGSHANYATSGQHQHDIPLLFDYTNDGLTWDMTKNFRGFWFDTASNTFTAAVGAGVGASVQAAEGLSWLSFGGRWGDQEYPLFIKNGQYCILEHQCKYVSGPTGPVDKNLGRSVICQKEADCTVETSI